jgi:hypothetical protein
MMQHLKLWRRHAFGRETILSRTEIGWVLNSNSDAVFQLQPKGWPILHSNLNVAFMKNREGRLIHIAGSTFKSASFLWKEERPMCVIGT